MSSVRILVIDDEPPIQKLLRTGLSTQGYHVVEAADGRAALEAVGREKVDLVILDLRRVERIEPPSIPLLGRLIASLVADGVDVVLSGRDRLVAAERAVVEVA